MRSPRRPCCANATSLGILCPVTTIESAPLAPQVQQAPPKHSTAENVAGIVIGAFVASLGLFLLKSAGVVTGGTAGLVLLVGHLVDWPFAVVFTLLNAPFVALAWRRRGPRFVVASAVAVALLSASSLAHASYLRVDMINPLYAALLGNLAAGIGILFVFRHHASLGGFTIVALVCQDRFGWRAGYVLLALDAVVVAVSALFMPLEAVALSAAGAVVVNLVVSANHRPGRYPVAL